jgi:hypothetical protein
MGLFLSARINNMHWPNRGDKKFFGMVHEIGLTDSCVILIDVGGPADGAAFIVTSRH